MLGTRPQPGLFTAANRLDLDDLGFYGLLARDGRRLFCDYQFRGLYAKRGRPSASPALMALACCLQHYEGISDEQVIQRCRFDLRWKAALDLDPLDTTAPFSKAAYQSWRARLVLHGKEGIAFERMVGLAVSEGLLPEKLTLALDSSPVRGRGAVKDTFNLLADAVRKVVRETAKIVGRDPGELAAEIGVERHFEAASLKGSEIVNWEDPEAVSDFLRRLLEDGERVVAEAEKQGCAAEAIDLLRKIVAQDVDEEGEQPKLRDGVSKGRTVSVSDPEQRHGHKSSGKKYTGHKAHLATETTTGLVVAVDTTAPSTADGAKTGDLIEESERTTGLEVEEVLGDSAYGTRPSIGHAEQAGVRIRTKMPQSPKGRFGPGDFTVSADRETAVCPAGLESAKTARSKDMIVHHWSPAQCATCPLRGQCLRDDNKATKRTLSVRTDFHDRRDREAWAATEEGREKLRERVVVEHAIGRCKNRGAGRSRFFGRLKTRLQWLWTAAVENYQTAQRLLAARAPAGTAGAAA